MSKRARIAGKFFGYPSHYDVKPPGPDGRTWVAQNPDGLFGFKLIDGRTVTPRDGFKFDFASIPRIAWRIVGPPTGHGKKANYGPAALIHDVLYVTKEMDGKPCTRKEADQTMLAAMKELKVSWWRRRLMYRVLRLFGRKHFGRGECEFP